MKFTVTQKDLSAKLAQVVAIVSSRPTHPIMSNVLIDADNDKIVLSVFDMSIGLEICIPAKVEVKGSTTIPAKLLGEIASKLPNLDILFDIKDGSASIKCGTGSYTLATLPANEYPEIPRLSDVAPINIDARILRSGLHSALIAVSSDESKQILTGVNIASVATGLDIAATDGHRLSVSRYPEKIVFDGIAATIPSRALRELDKILCSDNVDIYIDHIQIIFSVTGEHGVDRLTSRLIDGKYPDYNQLIPKSFSIELNANRQELICAIDRIAVLAAHKNNAIKIRVDSDIHMAFLSAEAPDKGSGEESIEVLTNDSIEIAFNVKYLTDALKSIKSEMVLISMNDPKTPVIISDPGNDIYTCLVMPIQIRS